MKNFQIKTHRLNATYHEPHFFILNKGNNSGKPLKEPCPNCFVIRFKCPKEKQKVYWTTFSLWKLKRFVPYLKGSVIPFITLQDLQNIILQTRFNQTSIQDSHFSQCLHALQKVEEAEQFHRNSLQLLEEFKKTIFLKYINLEIR